MCVCVCVFVCVCVCVSSICGVNLSGKFELSSRNAIRFVDACACTAIIYVLWRGLRS